MDRKGKKEDNDERSAPRENFGAGPSLGGTIRRATDKYALRRDIRMNIWADSCLHIYHVLTLTVIVPDNGSGLLLFFSFPRTPPTI
jgi:hypothetical protein